MKYEMFIKAISILKNIMNISCEHLIKDVLQADNVNNHRNRLQCFKIQDYADKENNFGIRKKSKTKHEYRPVQGMLPSAIED